MDVRWPKIAFSAAEQPAEFSVDVQCHEVRFLEAPIYDFKKFMLPDRQRCFFGLLLEVIDDPCKKLVM